MPVEIFTTTPFMETCMEFQISVKSGIVQMASNQSKDDVTQHEPSGETNIEFLTCSICLKNYNTPKILPCLHTFCLHCLSEYIPAHSLGVTCPICRQQSILPEEGVSALQDNHFILNLMAALGKTQSCTGCNSSSTSECVTCELVMCDSCIKEHEAQLDTESHDIMPISCSTRSLSPNGENNGHQMESLVCPNHNGLSLEYYCTNCETAVCEECATGCQSTHVTHVTIPLTDAILEHKQTLSSLVDKTKSRIPEISRAISTVDKVKHSLDENYTHAQNTTCSAFCELVTMLEKRRDELLTEMRKAYEHKVEILSSQQDDLRHTLSNMRSSCAFTDKALQCGNETEILLVRKEMSEKLTHLNDQPPKTSPNNNATLAFNDTDFTNLRKHIANAGKIQSNNAVAHESTASGEGLRKCTVNRCATVNVITKDTHGDLVKVGHSSLAAEVRSPIINDVIIPEIIDHKNGTYDINYAVPDVGVYQLSITLFDQPIKGSPFKIKSYKLTDSPDSHSSRIPKTVAVKQRGTKRPSSSRSQGSNRRSNTIEDDLLLRVGEKGRNRGQFTNPQGVVICGDRLLVADSNNQCIQVFNAIGEFKHKFGIRGRQSGQLQRPTGLAVTHNGNYLVADYDNKWISVFSPEGKYLNKLGMGKLLGPKGVAVDRDGRIIVVDNKQSCICIFQSTGKFLHKFGSRGNQQHQLAGPHFCAVKASNDIVISDFHNHCVKVFDPEGIFKFSFGSHGEGNGQFNAPTGVAVDDIGNMLVADWGNSRIQVFDKTGSFLSFINTTADPLYGPQGLTINGDKQVVVSDSGNHCIKIYRYLQ